jgi:hypothetical protein
MFGVIELLKFYPSSLLGLFPSARTIYDVMQLNLAFLAINANEPRFMEDLLFWPLSGICDFESLRLSIVFDTKF